MPNLNAKQAEQFIPTIIKLLVEKSHGQNSLSPINYLDKP